MRETLALDVAVMAVFMVVIVAGYAGFRFIDQDDSETLVARA